MTKEVILEQRLSEQDVEIFWAAGKQLVKEVLGAETELTPKEATIAVLMYAKGYSAGVESNLKLEDAAR